MPGRACRTTRSSRAAMRSTARCMSTTATRCSMRGPSPRRCATLRPNGVFATVKPREIQNEFGIVISGPIIKNKLFLFGNYGQYREQHGATISPYSIPTSADAGSHIERRLSWAMRTSPDTPWPTATRRSARPRLQEGIAANACARHLRSEHGDAGVPGHRCQSVQPHSVPRHEEWRSDRTT